MEAELNYRFFTGNRRRLRELFTGTAPIVITANGQLQRSGDSTYPFQQDANFWYLSGVREPDVMLFMDGDDEFLVLPKRSKYQEIFDGEVDVKSLGRTSGIKEVLEYEAGWELLGERLQKVGQVATVQAPPEYLDVYGMYTNPARRKLAEKLQQIKDDLKLVDISKEMMRLRATKQPAELAAIKQAIAITAESLQALMRDGLKGYSYEYEIEADLTRLFRKKGSNHAFDPIIASGKRACTLHNTGMQGKVSAHELLLFDIGAEHEGYAADISRTYALQKPSQRQSDVFDAVFDVQSYAFSLLKPGVVLKEYEQQVQHKVGEKLLQLGLIQANDAESVRKYYPHAASHHLGLNVHDVGDYGQPLEPGMVITVEPGIYIPEEGIGVRIEDDVAVTDTGIEVLSSALPSKLY